MKTNDLYTIAERSGIQVDRFNLKANRSISAQYRNKLFVGLDNNVSGAEERVCLAHELGHCQTLSFYNIDSPFDVRGKHERRATVWAIKAMIPYSDYIAALKQGKTDIYSLADCFGVTEDFMRTVVDYYSQNAVKKVNSG